MTFFISIGRRLDSVWVDKFVATLICLFFFIPYLISQPAENTTCLIDSFWFYFGLIGFALALCKDVVDGRSPAKLMFNLQVVDVNTNVVASPIRCLVRNFLFFLFFIDEIILLADQSNRRIGDWIAGTKVIFIDPSNHVESKTSTGQLILVFALSYGFVVLISFGLGLFFQ